MAVSFQDNFWGEDNRGFGVLLRHLKYGRRTSAALLSFIAMRIEIEEEYVRRLERLAKFSFPREEFFFGELGGGSGRQGKGENAKGNGMDPGQCSNSTAFDTAGALQMLVQQTDDLCNGHATLIDSLRQRLLWPLEQNLKEQSMVKKQHKQEMLRILKTKAAQQETVNKLKVRYHTRCKERGLLIDTDIGGLFRGKALERHQMKIRKAKELEQEADAAYRSGVYRLGELHSQWQSRMSVAATEFQRVDEARLELIKLVLRDYCLIGRFQMQEEARSYERLYERSLQCDRELELRQFVTRRATGTRIPLPPAYVNFYGDGIGGDSGGVEESLRHLSLRTISGSHPIRTPFALEAASDPSTSHKTFLRSVKTMIMAAPHSIILPEEATDAGEGDRDRDGDGDVDVDGDVDGEDYRQQPRTSVASSSPTSFSINGTTALESASVNTTGIPLFRVRTLYSYEAQQSDELSFKANQIIHVLSTEEDPWWYGKLDDRGTPYGLFPSNYIQRI